MIRNTKYKSYTILAKIIHLAKIKELGTQHKHNKYRIITSVNFNEILSK